MRTKATFMKTAAVMALATAALSGAADAVDLLANVDAVVITPITVTETIPMSFGNIAIIAGSNTTNKGSITLGTDGTVTDPLAEANGANIIALTGSAPGIIKVFVGGSIAVPMTVTVPLTATLTLASQDNLDVTAITVGAQTTGSGAVGDCSLGCTMTSAAANGNIIFPLGAVLTMAVGNGTYGDGTYAGTFTISAVYQ